VAAAALSSVEFDRLMQSVGPFEARPRLAVAVSGGSDSLALVLLAAAWASRSGGEIIALTVDHGLRPEAAAEARQVGRWLKAHRVRHRTLRWQPDPVMHFAGGIQAAARAARYGLLTEWCRAQGILHLAVAHQQEDQAETMLLRLARGSGLDGLAAMAAVAERDGVRLIRPLLSVSRARLRATLSQLGQAWIEDPTNENAAHARVRMRALMPALAAEGLDTPRLAAATAHLGSARAAIDDAVADLLAAAAAMSPAGYVRVDRIALAAAPVEVSLRALSRCLLTVGGGDYGPRLERLTRLHRAICSNGFTSAATLGGCRILPRRGQLLICREPAAAREVVDIRAGVAATWDGRFRIALGVGRPRTLTLRRLGEDGWTKLTAAAPDLRRHPIPPPVRPSLPSLWQGAELVAAPHLGYRSAALSAEIGVAFVPPTPFVPTRFTVA